MKRNQVIVVVVAVVGALIAWFLYLQHNRYYILTSSGGVAYEVDRKTGKTWVLHGGTKRLQESPSPAEEVKINPLPPDQLARLTGNASLGGYGWFSGKLYNGSDWVVEEVTFLITAKETDGTTRWSRRYKDDLVKLEPFESQKVNVEVTGDQEIGSFKWQIVEALGYRQQ